MLCISHERCCNSGEFQTVSREKAPVAVCGHGCGLRQYQKKKKETGRGAATASRSLSDYRRYVCQSVKIPDNRPYGTLKGCMNNTNNFKGYLECDAYGAYRKLSKLSEEIIVCSCWAHARRRFSDAVKAYGKTQAGVQDAEVFHEAIVNAFVHQKYRCRCNCK